MPGLLLNTLRGENVRPRPSWLMRQAGRYLPEYRALRAEKGGFLALVYDTEAAAEITIQPLRRYGMDGAILFSDILIVPYAMGQKLEFLVGEGPHLSPRLADAALASLQAVPERLSPIYETVKLVRAQLPADKTMLGFAGSPWTVATYMVAGEGSRDQHVTRELAYRDPAAFQAIIDGIVSVTIEYLAGQIMAGAEAVQLFDSWAGELAPAHYQAFAMLSAMRRNIFCNASIKGSAKYLGNESPFPIKSSISPNENTSGTYSFAPFSVIRCINISASLGGRRVSRSKRSAMTQSPSCRSLINLFSSGRLALTPLAFSS